VNTNAWKFVLPLLATIVAATFGLWLQPRSQPPKLEAALARFAAPEGPSATSNDCAQFAVEIVETGILHPGRGCREPRR